MDTSRAYEIEPAANGGCVVIEGRGDTPMGRPAKVLAAFTTPADMITWLAEQYGVVTGVTVSVDAPTPTEPEWTPWSGHPIPPVPDDAKVEVKFRHGGTIRHRAGFWSWGHASEPHPSDIIAYRLI